MPEEIKKPKAPSPVLAKIKTEIDGLPAAADTLARVIRLERVVELLAHKELDEILAGAEPRKE